MPLLHHPATAWVILLASLALTALAWSISDSAIRTNAAQRFEFQVQDIASAITTRLLTYETALRGGAGLFITTEGVNRDDWHHYVAGLKLQQNFPGIQGLGFSLMIAPAERARHIAGIRAEGFPDYAIRPTGERDLYSAIVYLEPFDWRNRRALGYDMFSEPVRRAAMERARDSGEPAISGRVILVQETREDVQSGFLMYMPVYRKGLPTHTTETRRAALLGFVYSPFRARDFMTGILGTHQDRLDFELFDGDQTSPETLLVDNGANGPLDALASPTRGSLSALVRIPARQRTWTLYVHALPGYLSATEEAQPLIVALGGVVIDLFLFILIASIAHQRRLAEQQSQHLAERLAETEVRYRTLLERSEAVMSRYRDVLAATGDGIWDWDIVTNRVSHNPQWGEILGIEQVPSDHPVEAFANLLYEDDRPAVMAAIQDALEGRAPYHHEHRMCRADGRLIWVLDRGQVVERDATGAPRRMLGSLIDVTERVQQEQALETERRRLRDVIAGTRAGTWEWNVQTGEVAINERLAEIVGCTLDELLPFTFEVWTSIVHPDDLIRSSQLVQRCFARELDYYECEVRMRHQDGHWVWVLDRGKITSWAEDGKPLLMAGTHQDISLQKENEAMLVEARQQAEAANIAKSRFLATMSHEIRTPLNGILGMAQLLLMPNLQESERHDYAQTILTSGQTLLNLLNDILDLSRIEAGKLQFETGPFQPSQVIQEICALFAEPARSRGLQLEARWSGPGDQSYESDAHRLRQMLANLVGNAIKFTSHGYIHLEARESERNGAFALLEFAVIDTGIGIPEDKQSLLFQPFSQTDNSTTRQYGGSGLGLSIVSSLARSMGGEVGVESRVGEGSRFWFTIRAGIIVLETAQTGYRPTRGETGEITALSTFTGRILVVEDNMTNRQLITALLRKFGLSVQVAENGQQGVEAILRGDTPDLVLMDLQMPVLDGYAATDRIRQWERDNDRPRLPIIALTADAFDEDRQRCLRLGMDDFISKPIAIDTLRQVLGRWLGAQSKPRLEEHAVS